MDDVLCNKRVWYAKIEGDEGRPLGGVACSDIVLSFGTRYKVLSVVDSVGVEVD